MTKSIVIQVCQAYEIQPTEFFDPRKRERRLVRARLHAIIRLRDAGFSMAGIARAMRRDYSTIRYWMRPQMRSYKRREAIAHRHKYPNGVRA